MNVIHNCVQDNNDVSIKCNYILIVKVNNSLIILNRVKTVVDKNRQTTGYILYYFFKITLLLT